MHTDPIADLLTRLRNADHAGLAETHAPYSKIKEAMLQIMTKQGLITNFQVEKNKDGFKEITVTLKKRPTPLHIRRISKPGQRIYVKADKIKAVLSGLGITILSTPKGIMSGKEARKNKLGGELLCEIA
ncbi:MAG: 30S ribosomal protein S8 [Candidatus Gracilibacteria bacterium]